jgi:hypothetical protein
MVRTGFLSVVVGLVLSAPLLAQPTGWQFRWQQGQVLAYRVEHLSSAVEVVGSNKSESSSKLNLTKRWQVLAVDAAGVATLQLSLTALRLETTTPSGGTLFYDSKEADRSTPQMREELNRFVGQPLAVIRVDSLGKVLEVKESRHGPASRFESEPPFVLTLPDEGLKAGQNWERTYKVTLEPPQGTGEKCDAVQAYTCKAVTENAAVVGFSTNLKTLPDSVLDRVPLLQMQPEGEVVFDTQAGRLHSAKLRIDKELTGHQGEGSGYRFQSTYTEEFLDNK